jgi:hypothetical protein
MILFDPSFGIGEITDTFRLRAPWARMLRLGLQIAVRERYASRAQRNAFAHGLLCIAIYSAAHAHRTAKSPSRYLGTSPG